MSNTSQKAATGLIPTGAGADGTGGGGGGKESQGGAGQRNGKRRAQQGGAGRGRIRPATLNWPAVSQGRLSDSRIGPETEPEPQNASQSPGDAVGKLKVKRGSDDNYEARRSRNAGRWQPAAWTERN